MRNVLACNFCKSACIITHSPYLFVCHVTLKLWEWSTVQSVFIPDSIRNWILNLVVSCSDTETLWNNSSMFSGACCCPLSFTLYLYYSIAFHFFSVFVFLHAATALTFFEWSLRISHIFISSHLFYTLHSVFLQVFMVCLKISCQTLIWRLCQVGE